MSWFLRFVGLLLLIAAYPKMRDPLMFFLALRAYAVFPSGGVPILGFYVPALEMVVGLALLLRPTMTGARWLALGLFAAFTLLLLRSRLIGLTLTCGCLGAWTSWLHHQPYGLDLHVLMNLVITLGLLVSQGSPTSSGSASAPCPHKWSARRRPGTGT